MDERPNPSDPTPPGAMTWIAFAVIVAILLMVLVALSLSQGENVAPNTTVRPEAAVTS